MSLKSKLREVFCNPDFQELAKKISDNKHELISLSGDPLGKVSYIQIRYFKDVISLNSIYFDISAKCFMTLRCPVYGQMPVSEIILKYSITDFRTPAEKYFLPKYKRDAQKIALKYNIYPLQDFTAFNVSPEGKVLGYYARESGIKQFRQEIGKQKKVYYYTINREDLKGFNTTIHEIMAEVCEYITFKRVIVSDKGDFKSLYLMIGERHVS